MKIRVIWEKEYILFDWGIESKFNNKGGIVLVWTTQRILLGTDDNGIVEQSIEVGNDRLDR